MNFFDYASPWAFVPPPEPEPAPEPEMIADLVFVVVSGAGYALAPEEIRGTWFELPQDGDPYSNSGFGGYGAIGWGGPGGLGGYGSWGSFGGWGHGL